MTNQQDSSRAGTSAASSAPTTPPAPAAQPVPATSTPQGPEKWLAWHAHRNESLAEPAGWLALVSFDWLPTTPQPMAHFPGLWHTDGERAVATFADPIQRDGRPFTGAVTFEFPNESSDFSLTSGHLTAEVARRGGRYALRVRDDDAVTRTGFTGVPVFDYDPSYVFEGRLVPVEPEVMPRNTYRADTPAQAQVVAKLELDVPGKGTTELLVEGDPQTKLQVVFHDETNGAETADWRAVRFRSPWAVEESDSASAEGAEQVAPLEPVAVKIDFNYSTNFPAAFTEFGTCPRPLPGNGIPAPIRAGERRPAAPAV